MATDLALDPRLCDAKAAAQIADWLASRIGSAMSEPVKRPLRFSLSLLPDHLAGGQVVGHVFDEADLEKRFVVELLIDGFPAALARAERFDADLARDGFGDGCYGFGFFVDAAALSSAHVLRSASPMAGRRWARPCCFRARFLRAEPPVPQSGAARWLGGLRINGWLGPEAAGRRVRALVDGQIVAEGLASHWTHVGEGRDVTAAPASIFICLSVSPMAARISRKFCDENGRELAGSPVAFVAFADGLARFIGDRAEIEFGKAARRDF